jgi:glycosyltransferase involved in cell wall biosynthesis
MLKLNNRFKILVEFIGVALSCILSLYIYSLFYRYTYRSTNRIIEIIKNEKHIENPKISVIIPVYNVEKFLRKCLDSVVNQTMRDIEIICINDGSTDGSLDILKEYAEKDDRIIVINQTNGFVGSARNNGLKIARGKYIQFVDSDDYLELNACETAYKYALQYDADVVVFGYKNFPKQVGNVKNKRGKGLKYKEVDVFHGGLRSGRHLCRSMIWNKLYRHKIIKGCYFTEWLRFRDDEHFNFQVDKKINTLVQIPEQLYNFRLNLNSITTSSNVFRKLIDTIFIGIDLIEHNELRFAKHYIKFSLHGIPWCFRKNI